MDGNDPAGISPGIKNATGSVSGQMLALGVGTAVSSGQPGLTRDPSHRVLWSWELEEATNWSSPWSTTATWEL